MGFVALCVLAGAAGIMLELGWRRLFSGRVWPRCTYCLRRHGRNVYHVKGRRR